MAGTVYPPIFGLKLFVVKARVPKQKRHDSKAVSHRNCARRAQKAGRKKPDNHVSEISSSCCIPLNGANRLSRKKRNIFFLLSKTGSIWLRFFSIIKVMFSRGLCQPQTLK